MIFNAVYGVYGDGLMMMVFPVRRAGMILPMERAEECG
jgi:hypothetical protein